MQIVGPTVLDIKIVERMKTKRFRAHVHFNFSFFGCTESYPRIFQSLRSTLYKCSKTVIEGNPTFLCIVP